MGLVDEIKEDVKKSATNKKKFIYFREKEKTRIRFLEDMDEGLKVKFHDSFEKSINIPCQKTFDRECKYCNDESLRTRYQFCWNVFDYEVGEVKLFMFPVNNCSPIPSLLALYENYGTITDRDYIIEVIGKGKNKAYSVIPLDKLKFRNDKVKPISHKKILQLIDEGWQDNVGDADDKQETEELEKVYADLPPQILYKKCKERNIEVEQKKPKKYYIDLLVEDDKSKTDWDDIENEIDLDDDEGKGKGDKGKETDKKESKNKKVKPKAKAEDQKEEQTDDAEDEEIDLEDLEEE